MPVGIRTRRLPGETHEQFWVYFGQATGRHRRPDDIYWAQHPDEAAIEARAIAAKLEELPGDLEHNFAAAYRMVGGPRALRRRVSELVRRRERHRGPRRAEQGWAATAGTLGVKFTYRSDWERRLATALHKLDVSFRYEPVQLDYRDGVGGWHTYTPDFALDRWPKVYIEVKGPAGPSSDATWKMALVLMRHPVTLLLWDAAVIETIEDMETADQLSPLRATTRIPHAA
jgi:hypothetical protein